MATARKRPAASIVVLQTHVGQDLLIRGNPTDAAVRKFTKEHHRRYLAGELAGPSGDPPYRIFNAKRYDDEYAYLAGAEPTGEIDLSDLLVTR